METYEIEVYELIHPSHRFEPGEWIFKATFNVQAASLDDAMDQADVILVKAGYSKGPDVCDHYPYLWIVGLVGREQNELPF